MRRSAHVNLVLDVLSRGGEITGTTHFAVARTLILDGEVAVYDEQLVSRFEWLRGRPNDEVATPPMFMAFDCLQLDEDDLSSQALRVRRERFEYVLDGAPAVPLPVRRLSDDGLEAWQEVIRARLRGSGGQRAHVTLRGRPDSQVAEGEASEVPGSRAGLLQAVASGRNPMKLVTACAIALILLTGCAKRDMDECRKGDRSRCPGDAAALHGSG